MKLRLLIFRPWIHRCHVLSGGHSVTWRRP